VKSKGLENFIKESFQTKVHKLTRKDVEPQDFYKRTFDVEDKKKNPNKGK
jgi:hypothetical protein